MRSVISILIALAYLSFNISKDKLAGGYVILQSGDRKEVKFILENKSPLVKEESDYDFSECRMQHCPEYIDADVVNINSFSTLKREKDH
jgi:hypothetical protein